jgi:anthranilate phosphoribosyltransferase
MKGERPAEIVGLARTMRSRATRLSREFSPVFDTCGTGGDRAHTFNVSTVAALVLAACGVRVAKHGNRSVSSRCGSADLFEALGVNVAADPATVERCLDQAGIAFFFAPTFHPSMRHAAPTRRELGVRTAFNLLGPLTNPANARRQLVGVPRPELTELVARSLALLGTERAWVVHGADGLDEISTTGYTKVSECRDGQVNTFYLHPSDAGLAKAAPDALRGGDAAENATIATAVLGGARGAPRDIVVLNAAAALLVAGKVGRIQDGLTLAADAIDSGRAAAALDDLRRLSNVSAEATT